MDLLTPVTALYDRDQLPRFLGDRFADIRQRAELMLGDRSTEDVTRIAQGWNTFFGQLADWLPESGDLPTDEAFQSRAAELVPASALSALASLDHFPVALLLQAPEVPEDLLWHEAYAVLALGLVGAALVHEDRAEPAPETLAEIGVDAMEILGLAQGAALAQDAEHQTGAKAEAQKRAQHQRAAQSRHADTDRLKEAFIAYYEAGDQPSRREAASRFYGNLSDADRRLLSPTNAVRTLTEALRAYERRW